MFQSPFSFEGRIRRSEFGFSLIIYITCYVAILGILRSGGIGGMFILAFIPLIWFLWAQGAKRCHDLGKSGIWQIVPLYLLWMLFQDGNFGHNEYGPNPKGFVDSSYSSVKEDPFQANKEDGIYGSNYNGDEVKDDVG